MTGHGKRPPKGPPKGLSCEQAGVPRRSVLRAGGALAGLGALQGLGLGGIAPRALAETPRRFDLTPARAPRAEMTLRRVAFGSCLSQTRPAPIMKTIFDLYPDLFLFLGDNVYGSRSPGDPALPSLVEAYSQAAAREDMQRLLTSVPVMPVWDDHDYGLNDGGGDFPYKDQAKELFLDFWGVPQDDPRRYHGGLYMAKTFGPRGKRTQVILLDTRYFRSPTLRGEDARGRKAYFPDPDPDKTILGPDQWLWLERQLREPAELRLICSSIQVLSRSHRFEKWANLPTERARLMSLIRQTRAGGVLFLSGDRHAGGIYKDPAALDYPVYEVTSSSLNVAMDSPPSEPDPLRLEPLLGGDNVGLVMSDWGRGTVRAELRDAKGTVRQGLDIAIADLQPNP